MRSIFLGLVPRSKGRRSETEIVGKGPAGSTKSGEASDLANGCSAGVGHERTIRDDARLAVERSRIESTEGTLAS